MIVAVTQEDIDKGEPRGLCTCPIARAGSRAYGKTLGAAGDGLRSALTWNVEYTFSESTRRKMSRYDRTGKMRPFRFRATEVA